MEWRKAFNLSEDVDIYKYYDLPVIYHSCGNVKKVYQDFIDIGIDAHNPLEAKAGLDVLELRGHMAIKSVFVEI